MDDNPSPERQLALAHVSIGESDISYDFSSFVLSGMEILFIF